MAKEQLPFRERMKELRKQAKLTQAGAAAILGVSHRTYHAWETGEAEPPAVPPKPPLTQTVILATLAAKKAEAPKNKPRKPKTA